MMLAGAKKCVPMTFSERFVCAAIASMSSVDVLLARIAPGFATPSSFAKTSLLDVHVLENGLDDDVGVPCGRKFALEARSTARVAARLLRVMRPRWTWYENVAEHSLLAAFDLFVAGFDDRDRDAGARERDRDARSHRAAADDGRRRDLERLRSRQSRNLSELAFREEDVHQRMRRCGANQFVEQTELARESALEFEFERGFDRVDQLVRGESAALFGRNHLVRLRDGERRREQPSPSMPSSALRAETALARRTPRTSSPRQMTSPSTTSSRIPSSCARVASSGSPLSMISSAGCAPIKRGRRCVPPAPGMRPSLISGKPTFARGVADAVVACERELETAAERAAVDCGDVRFRSALDARDDVANRLRIGRRLAQKVVDIGTAAKDAVAAGDDDCARPRHRFSAASIAATSSPESANPSALTGGLSSVRMRTPSRVVLRAQRHYAVTADLRSSSNWSSESAMTLAEPLLISACSHRACVST